MGREYSFVNVLLSCFCVCAIFAMMAVFMLIADTNFGLNGLLRVIGLFLFSAVISTVVTLFFFGKND